MVKRLHEYKRQTLKVLHIVTEYERIISGEVKAADITPRTFIFGAKAAPGYKIAKDIIHLINGVGAVVNNDKRVEGRLKVLFPPNYNVTLAEKVIPAADLSEQISLAGKEASGTGNMKFALNGALTIGTDDGANIEIRELVGDDNFFLFGLLEPEVEALYAKGYVPSSFYESDPSLKRAIDLIAQGAFSGGDRDVFAPVVGNLLYEDRFMALADYRAYIDAQAEVGAAYADTDGVDEVGHPQRRPLRLLLLRPLDAQLHRPDLEHPAVLLIPTAVEPLVGRSARVRSSRSTCAWCG